MTNTLICREDVLSELSCCCSENSHEMFRAGIETAIEILEHAPTEFDMEKVIEKLNQEKLRKDSIVLGSQVMITVREAVELVKNGWRD